uniref:glycosyl hydrolase family 18 protein n=1 Tax=Agathobacter sp. TaxID=2021311 RepID=UPI0040578D0B
MRRQTDAKRALPKKALPILIVAGFIFLVLCFIIGSALLERYTPTKERMELTDYYEITDESQVAITLNQTVLDSYGKLIDGHIYLDYHFVHDILNSRFYWDSNENILLYTTSNEVISAKSDSSTYTVSKSTNDYGRAIVKANADSAWVDMEFVKAYSDFTYTIYENPNRVVINNSWEEITTASVKKNTQVRQKGGIKSPILSDVAKNDTVTVLEADKKWTKVCTEDGITGYIRSNYVKNTKQTAPASEFVPETFSHIKIDKPINLVWHQVYGSSSGAQASELLTKTKGVNVVSPTWFKVKNNNGDISSIANTDYVSYCHSQGVQVWGLISNFEDDSVDTSYLLTHTSSRQNLVNQLIGVALQYNLDGINVDFESMNGPEVGDGYIQFIRELSIKCANNDIILSVDVPVPAAYNNFYHYTDLALFADYVVVMAYDEHYSQASGEGSVASLSWTEEAINNLLAEEVPADQILFGIPFYTRLWNLTPGTAEDSSESAYIIGFENLGMNSASKWMADNIEEPVWLDDCGQYYGECEKNGKIYKMWLEDNASLEARLQLMNEYNLAGAAFWKYGLESSTSWDVIIKYIN